MPKKLLVVEDSATMRQMIAATLGQVPGLEISQCAGGFEALKTIPRERFDMVLTDINMPDINGLELIGFLKANPDTRDIPVIILSSEGALHDLEKGMALGAAAYIVKPFQPEGLRATVLQHLFSETA